MEFNHTPPEHLDEIALATMQFSSEDEMLAYRADGGVDLMRFIETGETTLQTLGIGNETMSFELAVKEPLISASFDSLREYAGAPVINTRLPDNAGLSTQIEQDPTFLGEQMAIISKATEQSELLSGTDRFLECPRNCSDGVTVRDCLCTHGGSSYTDLDGTTVKTREQGTPDPSCKKCDGTGKHASQCYECKGAGRVLINPIVTVINHQTSAETGFRLNIAQLIADNLISVSVSDETRRYTRSSVLTPPERQVTLDFSRFMQTLANEVEIDITRETYYTYWGESPLETLGTTFGHLLRPVVVNVIQPDQFDSLDAFAEVVVQELQKRALGSLRKDFYGIDTETSERSAIQAHAKTFDLEMNDDMTIRKFGLRIDKANSPYANLQELINTLSIYNYRLGFAYTGIATGESGPALYILDYAGNLISEISSGYEASIVLENANKRIRDAHLKGEINPGNIA